MKKIIFMILIIMANFSVASAAIDYVLAKKGAEVTIYTIYSANGVDEIFQCSLTNPTIGEINAIVPEGLAMTAFGKDGVYDTRLEGAKKELSIMQNHYDKQKKMIVLLEKQNYQDLIYGRIIIFIFFVLGVLWASGKIKIRWE